MYLYDTLPWCIILVPCTNPFTKSGSPFSSIYMKTTDRALIMETVSFLSCHTVRNGNFVHLCYGD